MVERSRFQVPWWFWHVESYSETSFIWHGLYFYFQLFANPLILQPQSMVTMIQHCCSRQMVAAGWGVVWCLIVPFSPTPRAQHFLWKWQIYVSSVTTAETHFFCFSGFNWPFDFVEPHKFSTPRLILLAPIHCSHLSKPESISAPESSPWSHYRAVQSPASLLKAQYH